MKGSGDGAHRRAQRARARRRRSRLHPHDLGSVPTQALDLAVEGGAGRLGRKPGEATTSLPERRRKGGELPSARVETGEPGLHLPLEGRALAAEGEHQHVHRQTDLPRADLEDVAGGLVVGHRAPSNDEGRRMHRATRRAWAYTARRGAAGKVGKQPASPSGKWGLVPRRVSRFVGQLNTPPLALQSLLLSYFFSVLCVEPH